MPIAINGSGTITGVSVGGLPDGIVDADMLASSAVTTAKINDDAVTDAKQSLSGAAKAWVNYNQVSPGIRDSFNVSSVTDHSTGLLTLNFTNALANANYTFAGTVAHVSPSGATTAIFTVELPDGANISSVMTTTSLQLEVNYVTKDNNRSVTDRELVGVIIFGD